MERLATAPPEQPIFYPVLDRWYATKIAREWNVPASGAGFITSFEVDADWLRRYDVQQVGGRDVLEYWMPAEELEEFNRHIGRIELVAEYRPAVENLPEDPIWRDYLQQKSWFRRGFLPDGRFVHVYRPEEAPAAGIVGLDDEGPVALLKLAQLRELLDQS